MLKSINTTPQHKYKSFDNYDNQVRRPKYQVGIIL